MINKLDYWWGLELGTHDKQARLLEGCRAGGMHTISKLDYWRGLEQGVHI